MGRLAIRAVMLVALVLGCGAPTSTPRALVARTTTQIRYYHRAVGAGPSLITGPDGSVFDERRYEPTGAAIDALHDGAAAATPVDYTRDPHDALDQRSDPATGWSDHGPRWAAPETARWLTGDPRVAAPDPELMASPWSWHPYQYVEPRGRPADLVTTRCPAPGSS